MTAAGALLLGYGNVATLGLCYAREVSMSSATVLIIDDDANVRQSVRVLLTRAGYRVIEAADGREAIAMLTAGPEADISAILVDLQMPHVNGVEVIRYLQDHCPTVPFIILTADHDFLLTEILAKQGVCDYLIKPVAKDKLLESIRVAVHLHQLRKQQLP
jgi:DNA-binding NtrC family response regulator